MGMYLDGRNGIRIGTNTWMGPRVSIISMNHNTVAYKTYMSDGPVVIGNDCWLGANVIILPGVTLGNHVVCAAGAVVTKSFPENDILLAGVPARVMKQLGPYQGEVTTE